MALIKLVQVNRILLFAFLVPTLLWAQEKVDTVKSLEAVTIKGNRLSDVDRLPAVLGTHIMAGKKTEVIHVGAINANIAEKTPRQIFAKVPGVFVYDMDGSGNQTNISTRGLDPHRGWEYNIRKNGVITNSDMYAYPASHYSMPMEAVERIELVRGTGALQYGAQFGGMLNYVSKRPDTTRAFIIENINSIGSFGLFSTYASVSGKVGKFQYLVYYSKRVSKGYRRNSESAYDAQSVMLIYDPSKNVRLTAELSRSSYLYHIPGQLTDSMFRADPRQSTRSRNYFNPEIYVPSLRLEWLINPRTKLEWTSSAVLGYRNSVMFDKLANVVDAINPSTLEYANRQVDIDNFNSYTSELRLLHAYSFFNRDHVLLVGTQYFNNDLHRRQLGKGTTGSDFDLTLVDRAWGRDVHLKTQNVAVFVENKFQVTNQLSVSPGFRMETGQSRMSGTISYYDENDVPNTIRHNFPLLGVQADFKLKGDKQFYGGWSESYRPVIFKDIIPASLYERVDKNLKDATGYNLEVGFRGSSSNWRWDVGLFQLRYNNRMGSQATFDDSNVFYLYRTNIGNSLTSGAELFGERSLRLSKKIGVTVFTSTALIDGRYVSGEVRSGNENVQIKGKKIESVPEVISRTGLTLRWTSASISFLYSYTGKTYADAINTEIPSANGAVGVVPSYSLLDINSSFRLFNGLIVRVNLNNVLDKQYFTKRPQFYPGPGVWSSDGRSVSISLGYKI